MGMVVGFWELTGLYFLFFAQSVLLVIYFCCNYSISTEKNSLVEPWFNPQAPWQRCISRFAGHDDSTCVAHGKGAELSLFGTIQMR